jgi:DNA-binding NarL/FixJ family response regulator
VTLTPRQREVLAAYLRTGSYHGAARELGLTRQTVANHLHATYNRLGARSLLGALRALSPGDELRLAFVNGVREVPS